MPRPFFRVQDGWKIAAATIHDSGPSCERPDAYFGPNTSMAIRPAFTAQGHPA
jgi:hypothetical protein